MSEGDWYDGGRRVIGLLFGDENREPDDRLFLMYLNAYDAELTIVLPPRASGWELYIDTAGDPRSNVFSPLTCGPEHSLQPRSLVLFHLRAPAANDHTAGSTS